MRMSYGRWVSGYLLSSTLLGALAPFAMAADSVVEALADGTTQMHLRVRYEHVEQEGLADAAALTVKSRLTYTSGTYRGFGGVTEVDDVTALTDVDYSDGTGIYPGTATIPDPEGTEVNQAYVAYSSGETVIKYGRQRILLDNQRFVGGVGWRQNEQTYDGLSVHTSVIEDLSLFYAYVHNVNRIFGETVGAGDHEQDTHLLNGRYSGWQAGSLVGYAYLIDNETATALGSDTYGVRWEGKLGDRFAYNLEYATQREAGSNPVDYSADYYLLESVTTLPMLKLTAGYEVLGSDGGEAAFATPLATLHKFQGWSDKFLVTPSAGVEDLYVSAAKRVAGVNVAVAYHQLKANEGSLEYGSEVGITASRSFGPVAVTFKLADYSADEFATDTRKVWLMAAASF